MSILGVETMGGFIMIYGYARVSTKGQQINGNSLEEQRIKLSEIGCNEIIEEQFTGATTDRPLFDELINNLKRGDTLAVTKLDRFARNVKEGIELIKELFNKEVKVHVLNVGLLENSPMGNFFITTLLAVAELERSMIAERVQAGKAVARTKAGFREGRPPTDSIKLNHAVELINVGHSYKEVVAMTGISKSTIIRAVKRYRDSLE